MTEAENNMELAFPLNSSSEDHVVFTTYDQEDGFSSSQRHVLKNENGDARTWKTEFFGDYNWSFLCMPRSPFNGNIQTPPFYSKDEKIPIFLALVMGLQHALAMVKSVS